MQIFGGNLTPVSDEEFNTYGYVAEAYGGSPDGSVVLIPHERIPPKQVITGEIKNTIYYFEPTSHDAKERIRVARLIMVGIAGDVPKELGDPILPPKCIKSRNNNEEHRLDSVLVNNVEIFANILDDCILVDDLDEATELITLKFLGCPAIELGIDELGNLMVIRKRGVLEALSVLFGNPKCIYH